MGCSESFSIGWGQDGHLSEGYVPGMTLIMGIVAVLVWCIWPRIRDLNVASPSGFGMLAGRWTSWLKSHPIRRPTLIEGSTRSISRMPLTLDPRLIISWLNSKGLINVTKPGDYTFSLSSDDGSQLEIDDTLVVDHDGIHPFRPKLGSIRLAKGTHPILIRMFESRRRIASFGMEDPGESVV